MASDDWLQSGYVPSTVEVRQVWVLSTVVLPGDTSDAGWDLYKAAHTSESFDRWHAEEIRQAKAEALREAGTQASEGSGTGLGGNDWFPTHWAGQVDGWLNERAARIAGGDDHG